MPKVNGVSYPYTKAGKAAAAKAIKKKQKRKVNRRKNGQR
jgi:hypothetical protein